jgi:hypothetical protein
MSTNEDSFEQQEQRAIHEALRLALDSPNAVRVSAPAEAVAAEAARHTRVAQSICLKWDAVHADARSGADTVAGKLVFACKARLRAASHEVEAFCAPLGADTTFLTVECPQKYIRTAAIRKSVEELVNSPTQSTKKRRLAVVLCCSDGHNNDDKSDSSGEEEEHDGRTVLAATRILCTTDEDHDAWLRASNEGEQSALLGLLHAWAPNRVQDVRSLLRIARAYADGDTIEAFVHQSAGARGIPRDLQAIRVQCCVRTVRGEAERSADLPITKKALRRIVPGSNVRTEAALRLRAKDERRKMQEALGRVPADAVPEVTEALASDIVRRGLETDAPAAAVAYALHWAKRWGCKDPLIVPSASVTAALRKRKD